ncbi:MAG: surface protein [Planctomycetaceae bacterium]|nr:MAG: surface protein [Planctomycetaceae bacterium]
MRYSLCTRRNRSRGDGIRVEKVTETTRSRKADAAWLRRGTFYAVIGICLYFAAGLVIHRGWCAESPESVSLLGPGKISYRWDVMAALSHAGCNAGTCHGNARGKGGFQLSLRGEDPARDYLTLTREAWSRRVNLLSAEQSLLLRKATMQVAHGGGQRFSHDSWEYRCLERWIAAGMPADSPDVPVPVTLRVEPAEVWCEPGSWEFQLQVTAYDQRGRAYDVTRRAVYEVGEPIVTMRSDGVGQGLSAGESVVIVRFLDLQQAVRLAFLPSREAAPVQPSAAAHPIDQLIEKKLHRLRISPGPLCDDTTFLRRVSWDLRGIPPTEEEARHFLQDPSPHKRQQWIETCLQHDTFARFWSLKLADMLRVEEKTLDVKGAQVFRSWLKGWLTEDRPLDELVVALVTARGSTYSEPPSNFYRALRDPFSRAEAVAQLFLGVRLQCARCHSHPFDRWTQDDYYSWGNVFAQLDYKILENRRRDVNDQHEFDGEQIVYLSWDRQVPDPRTGNPREPRPLGGDQKIDSSSDRLAAMADWLVRRQTDRLAQVWVNRIWRHVMGHGLVEPVDDFRLTNPPTHPDLLQHLTQVLRSADFRLKALIRHIMSSEAYQRSGNVPGADELAERNYAVGIVRRLTAEQLLDGWMEVTGSSVAFRSYPAEGSYPAGMRAADLPGVGVFVRRRGGPLPGDVALQVFGKPPRLQACECERSEEQTLAQAFQLTSGPVLHHMLQDPQNRLQGWLTAELEAERIVEHLFWTTLSRAPREEERLALQTILGARHADIEAWRDVWWALLTSHEFLFRY